jgi:hypothetical protein
MVEINSPFVHHDTVLNLLSSVSIPLRYERRKMHGQDDGMHLGDTSHNTHETRTAHHQFKTPRMSTAMNSSSKRTIHHHTPKNTVLNHGRRSVTTIITAQQQSNNMSRMPRKEIP